MIIRIGASYDFAADFRAWPTGSNAHVLYQTGPFVPEGIAPGYLNLIGEAGPLYIGGLHGSGDYYIIDYGVLDAKLSECVVAGCPFLVDIEHLAFDTAFFNTLKLIQDRRDTLFPSVELVLYNVGPDAWINLHEPSLIGYVATGLQALVNLFVSAGCDDGWIWTYDAYWRVGYSIDMSDGLMENFTPIVQATVPGGRMGWFLWQAWDGPSGQEPMTVEQSARQITKALQVAGMVLWFNVPYGVSIQAGIAAFPAVEAFLEAGHAHVANTGPAIAAGAMSNIPAVESDGDESWIGEGCVLTSRAHIAPADATRVTLDVLLAGPASVARIVMPYAESSENGSVDAETIVGGISQYVEVEAVRQPDNTVVLSAYLTDHFVGASRALLATSHMQAVDASQRANFTVECGRRFVRAWWQPTGSFSSERLLRRFQRTTPDIGGHVPDIDSIAWGFLTVGGRVYQIEIDQDPVEALGSDLMSLRVGEESDDPYADTSSAALVQYTVGRHAKRRRGILAASLYGPSSSGAVADHVCHRLDPSQTIVPSPVGESTTVRVGSVLEGVSGPSSTGVPFVVVTDPSGLDGGIGSGRSVLDVGGELALSPGHVRGDSTMGFEQQDEATDLGGQEAYQQAASRQRRRWDVSARNRPDRVRLVERVLAASGGVRPVWFMPPLTPEPAAVSLSGVSHEVDGAKRATVHFNATEV